MQQEVQCAERRCGSIQQQVAAMCERLRQATSANARLELEMDQLNSALQVSWIIV